MTEPASDELWQIRVERGSFTIPAALFEDGLELELARFFAQRMPDRATAAGRTAPLPNGDVVVRWRIVHRDRIA